MINEIQKCFNENGYVIIREHLPKNFASILYSYTLKKSNRLKHKIEGKDYIYYNKNWDGFLGDETCGLTSYNFYGDELIETLLEILLTNMEEYTGLKLVPTYGFLRLYQKGNELPYHSDRDSCEISTTVFLGHNIENVDTNLNPNYNWLIHLEKNKEKISISLNPGDMLIYKGIELPHWREKFIGNNHVQAFLHYNNMNKEDNNVLDKRKALGLPSCIKK